MAKKAQKGGGSALDLGMAAFAATSAGFVVYAMPPAQFDRAVELSGLPLLLAAAQPPLGMTARAAAIAAVAIGTWLLVWLILRALGKKPPEPKRRPRPMQIEVPTPRIRRADAHPDAPARAPIFAGLELGTPLDEALEQADRAEAEQRIEAERPIDSRQVIEPEPASLPVWLQTQPEEDFDEPDPLDFSEPPPPRPGFAELEQDLVPAAEEFPLTERDPRDFMEVEDDGDELELSLDHAVAPRAVQPEPAEPDWPEPQPFEYEQSEPEQFEAEQFEAEQLEAEQSEPQRSEGEPFDPTAPSAAELEQASISHLMQRLELGLLRRERSTWDLATGEAQRRDEPKPELDQRLRSAIDDLQRLASRGG